VSRELNERRGKSCNPQKEELSGKRRRKHRVPEMEINLGHVDNCKEPGTPVSGWE
jgi:hypothetical protein